MLFTGTAFAATDQKESMSHTEIADRINTLTGEVRVRLDEMDALAEQLREPVPAPEPDPEPVPEPEAPPVPESLTATVDQERRTVKLEWRATAPDHSYVISEHYYHGERRQVGMSDSPSSTRGPLLPARYGYTVASRNAEGVQSADSAIVEVVVGTTPPPTTEPSPAPEPAPEPSPSPSPSVIPAGAKLLFTGDYNTGNFLQWGTIQQRGYNSGPRGYTENYRAQIVNDGPGHETAARFEVRPGDVPPFGGSERSEVSAWQDSALTRAGDERYYAFSMKFEDYPPPSEGYHSIVAQWHPGSGSPAFMLSVDYNGDLVVGQPWDSNRRVIGPRDEGVWHDYVVHAKFDRKGWVKVYRDGELVVPQTSWPTLISSENYFKMGIYRGHESYTQSVLQDGLKIYAP